MEEMVSAALLIIAVGAATIYAIFFLTPQVSWPRSILKTLPLGCAALLAALLGAPFLLITGMGLSAIGDFALSRDGERSFIAGLVAFLAAHLAYIALFFSVADDAPWGMAASLSVAALGLYGVIYLALIWRRLGEMRIPVAAYVATILGMGVAAIAAGDLFLIIGAIMFIASDSILALEMFVFTDKRRSWTAPTIWETYIGAQFAIALPFLGELIPF